ncbi:MAG: DNA repair exonuclease [Thermofilaceae archaeon]
MAVVKVLHTADNHLDPKLTELGAKSMERRRDFLSAFQHAVNFALERRPHLFLVSGDLFDSVNPRNPARTQVIRAFRRLHSEGVRVFLIGGNHDMPRSVEEGMSPLHEIEASGYARFFSSPEAPEVEHVSVDGLDVAVVGLSYNPAVPPDANPLKHLSVRLPREGDLAIAMLHYNFAGLRVPPFWRAPTFSREDVPGEYRYLALGHIHSRAVVDLGSTVVAYPGSTERRSFGEEGDEAKGFLWVELQAEGKPRLEFVETPARPMRTVRVEVPPRVEDPISHILQNLPPSDPKLLLRLIVSGLLPLSGIVRYSKAALLRRLEGRYFHTVIEDGDLRFEVRTSSVPAAAAKSPIEAFRVEMEERMRRAQTEEERAVLELAFKLGLQKLEEAGAW